MPDKDELWITLDKIGRSYNHDDFKSAYRTYSYEKSLSNEVTIMHYDSEKWYIVNPSSNLSIGALACFGYYGRREAYFEQESISRANWESSGKLVIDAVLGSIYVILNDEYNKHERDNLPGYKSVVRRVKEKLLAVDWSVEINKHV